MINEICLQKIAQLQQARDKEPQEKNVLALNKLINHLENFVLLQSSYKQYELFRDGRDGKKQQKWLDDTDKLLSNLMTSILNIVNVDPFLFHPWLDANYDLYQLYFTPIEMAAFEMAALKQGINQIAINAIRTLAGNNNVTRTEAGFETFLSIMGRVDEDTRICCLSVCMNGFNPQWSQCSQEWLIQKLDAYDLAWQENTRFYTPPGGGSAAALGKSISNVLSSASVEESNGSIKAASPNYDSTNSSTEPLASLLKNVF